jgi:uncharacterized protein (TIGR02246 family)
MDERHGGSTDEQAVRKVVEDWVSAVRNRDLAAVLCNHSSDIVMFDVPPPFQSRGIDAYKKTWDQFFGWAHDPAIFEVNDMKITAGSDVAFVSAAMRCAGSEPGGESVAYDFRLTIGLRKMGDQWTISHEHHSVPAT